MFKINTDLSIEITRGDAATFNVTAQNNGENYVFQAGDIVRFKVFEKKGCDCVVLQKDFAINTATEEASIELTEADTKIGDLIHKPKDYWYEVELNPDTYPQTIIGYDENGAKVFKLYPEGRDLADDPITPEDIPFVDKGLDMTSHRPVENQVIATEFALVRESIKKNAETATEELEKMLPKSGGTMTGNLNMGGNKVTGLATPANDTDAVSLGYIKNNYALKTYVENITHLYRGEYVGNIDSKELNGVYWIQSAKCTGTFPSAKADYAFLEATKNKQKLINISTNNYKITRIHERVWFNNRWFDWVRTDSIDSLPLSGGTMTGAIAMGGYKITGLGTPTANADAATKAYADTKAPLINGGTYYGDLNVLGDGGVPLNSVVWVTPDTVNVPHSNWGFVETWQAQTGSEIQRYTGIDKVTYVRTRFGDGNSVDWHGGWQRTDSLGKFARLWSNSSPNSQFGTQTIILQDLSKYKYIGVAATWDVSNPHRTLPFHIATIYDHSNGNYYYHGGYLGGKHPKDNSFVGRSMDVTTNTVVFSDAYKDGSTDNRYCIPFAIFGISI